jgi:oligopeptide/dipeptide ABC transporter ATP-binding protein
MLEPGPLSTRRAVRNLVEVRGLVKRFPLPRRRGARLRQEVVHAVEDVSLDVRDGEFLALVGESGSGKTTLANCIAHVHDPTAGSIRFDGRPLVEVAGTGARRRVRWHASRRQMASLVQLVFQDPSSALNPRHRIRTALMQPLLVHGATHAAARKRALDLLEMTDLPASAMDSFPHELNAGQRQRVVIARALTLEPRLLLADEAVSRLDVSMQSKILNLLLTVRAELGLTVLFITHDLSVVRQVADRVAVMYLGRLMEVCDADHFFAHPSHPYSAALMASTPRFRSGAEGIFTLHGEIPSPITPPRGCPFVTRCPEAIEPCGAAVPALRPVGGASVAACIRRGA